MKRRETPRDPAALRWLYRISLSVYLLSLVVPYGEIVLGSISVTLWGFFDVAGAWVAFFLFLFNLPESLKTASVLFYLFPKGLAALCVFQIHLTRTRQKADAALYGLATLATLVAVWGWFIPFLSTGVTYWPGQPLFAGGMSLCAGYLWLKLHRLAGGNPPRESAPCENDQAAGKGERSLSA